MFKTSKTTVEGIRYDGEPKVIIEVYSDSKSFQVILKTEDGQYIEHAMLPLSAVPKLLVAFVKSWVKSVL